MRIPPGIGIKRWGGEETRHRYEETEAEAHVTLLCFWPLVRHCSHQCGAAESMYGEVLYLVKGWVGGDDLVDQETHFDGANRGLITLIVDSWPRAVNSLLIVLNS